MYARHNVLPRVHLMALAFLLPPDVYDEKGTAKEKLGWLVR
jgi:hypothetical protein